MQFINLSFCICTVTHPVESKFTKWKSQFAVDKKAYQSGSVCEWSGTGPPDYYSAAPVFP